MSSRHRLGATQATKKKGPGILIFIGAAVSLAIAGCCLTTSLLTPIWRNYTPPDESFTVSFPAKPEVVNKTFQTANGPVAFTSYSVKNALLGRVYGVQIYEPEKMAPVTDEEARLDGAADSFASELKGRVAARRPITLDSRPGREVEILATQGGELRVLVRFFVIKGRAYNVAVFQAANRQDTPDDRAFLDSFHVR